MSQTSHIIKARNNNGMIEPDSAFPSCCESGSFIDLGNMVFRVELFCWMSGDEASHNAFMESQKGFVSHTSVMTQSMTKTHGDGTKDVLKKDIISSRVPA